MKTALRTIALVAAVNLATTPWVLAQAPPQGATALQPAGASSGEASLPVASTPPPSTSITRLKALLGPTRSATGSVLIVPAAEISLDQLTAVTEDMTVMARILETALRQASPTTPAFGNVMDTGSYGSWSFWPAQTAQDAQNVYLQGYGALFTMKVPFPLSPGPDEKDAAEETVEADVDPVWQQARQDMYDPGWSDRGRRSSEEPVKYSAEKVDALKTRLITALKHAANIRNMTPQEAVIVMITGQAVSNRIESVRTVPGTNQIVVVERGRTRVYEGGRPDDIERISAPTVLTLRARRADIDSFAKGDLSLEQFRRKVQILTYPLLGGDIGSSGSVSFTTGISTR